MKIYISNYLSKNISILNYETFLLEEDIQLEEGIYPHHFCIDKEKNLMYIPSLNDGVLYVLDLSTNEIVDNISIGGSLSQIALYKGELFVSNEDSNSIYILQQDDLKPIGIISVDEMPHGFDLDVKNDKLYVPCINSIVCIDTIKKSIEKRIISDFKAWHIKIDTKKGEIYISTLDGKLVILDEDTMGVKSTIDNFLLPVEICFNYSKNKVYIADLGYKNIKILEYDSGICIGDIEVNGNPQGLEISKDEKRLFVSDTQNNSIKIYDTDNHNLIKEVKVGKEPTTILCM